MTTLNLFEGDIPSLNGKNAIITGGASGIGYGAAKILCSKGCKVHILDLWKPEDESLLSIPGLTYHNVDITSWPALLRIFKEVGTVDYAFANAGVSEETNYFADSFDSDGELVEPQYGVLNVNLRATMNFVKLAWSTMKRNGTKGSIVITTSATAYAPEQSLPVYAAGKLALVNLIRALRSVIIKDGITINGVAPAATITRLLPQNLAAPIIAMGLPVSSSEFVGLALVWSAVGTQERRVEAYGKEKEKENNLKGRWNGRVILTLGDQYTEMEEKLSDLKPEWFGKENHRLTREQQAATDFRPVD